MIATAETSTDLRERTQRQRLGEIHRHLPRAHHIGRAPRRQKVRAADIVLPRHHPLNVFDFDPLRFLRTDQVAHLAFGHFERDWLAGQLAVSQKSVSAPSRSRPLWVTAFAMNSSTGSGTSNPG